MLGSRIYEDDHEVDIRHKVILNVGGIRHETYLSTLRNIPDTRLHSLTNNNPTQLPEFDANSGEFFFDRHPIVFAQVLNYYRTGKLHCPSDACGPLFEDELAFWGLEDASIETCCWMNYKKHGEAQANLSSFDKIVGDEATDEHDCTFHENGEVGQQTRNFRQVLRKYQSRIWLTMEEPSYSMKAKILAMTSMLLIVASVVVSCLETVEYFTHKKSPQHQVISTIEIICVIWFTLEILVRVIVCPSKRDFVKQITNWLDLAAIAPFYLQLFLTNSDTSSMVSLRIIRLIRVFRVFKLSRHSYSLQILGHTLRSSMSELFLLGFFLSIGVVVFSTLMFYAEGESSKTKFTSIPAGFWWAVVTMTTVGYGDTVPDSVPGKLVGACCAICGVLTVALPIPVIVSNFSLYYSHAKAKQKLVKKKRPLVIGAANALKVIGPFVGSRATRDVGLRKGALGDNSNHVTPRLNGRRWPAVALEMGASSFESSEPSPRLARRRLSRLTDRLPRWPYDTTQGKSPVPSKRHTVIKIMDDDALMDDCEGSRCGEEENTACNENQSHAAYNNEGAELPKQNGYNEHTNRGQRFTLPTIEIQANSSASARSRSNSDLTENSDKLRPNKDSIKNPSKKKSKSSRRSEKKSNKPETVITPGIAGKIPQGRMGRRGSVFVVGFIGKKWQAKAAKRKNSRVISQPKTRKANEEPTPKLDDRNPYFDFLQVSPTISRRSTPHDCLSIVTNTTGLSTPNSPKSPYFRYQQPSPRKMSESRFARCSSCPSLQASIFDQSPNLGLKKPLRGSSSDESYVNTRMARISKIEPGNHGITVTNHSEDLGLGQRDLTEGVEPGIHGVTMTNHSEDRSLGNHGLTMTNHLEEQSLGQRNMAEIIEASIHGVTMTNHSQDRGLGERNMTEAIELSNHGVTMTNYLEEQSLGQRNMTEAIESGSHGVTMTNHPEDRGLGERDLTEASKEHFDIDRTLARNPLSRKQHSISGASSDSSLRGSDGASRSSSLVRQKAFFSCSIDKQQSDSEVENQDSSVRQRAFFAFSFDKQQSDSEVENQDSSTLNVSQEMADTSQGSISVSEKMPQLVGAKPDVKINKTLAGTTIKTKLTERRKAQALNIEFPTTNNNTLDCHVFNIKGNNEADNDVLQGHDQHLVQENAKHNCAANECNGKIKEQNKVTDVGVENPNDPSPVDKFHQIYESEQDTCWNGGFKSRNYRTCDQNGSTPRAMRQYSEVSTDQVNCRACENPACGSSNQRQLRSLMTIDSGISSVDSRSSIDLLPMCNNSPNEEYRRILQPISEDEKHDDCSNAEDMALSRVGKGQCENAGVFFVDIKDDTVI